MNKKKLIEIIKWFWMVIVVAAGIYYVVNNYQAAIDYLQKVRPAGLAIAVLFIIISRLLNVDLIRESVKEVGWKPGFMEMFSLVSLTQLGKYIPGGVWQFAARFGAYKDNQLTVRNMGKAFFLENVWVVLGGVFGGLFFTLLGDPENLVKKMGISIPFPLTLTLVILSILLWLLGLFIFQKLVHKTEPLISTASRTLRLFASHFLMYVTMGISFFFLFPVWNEDSLFFIIGGYILSYLVGYVAIFAPGGIGVREVVSVAIFVGIAPQAELAALTIVHRFLYTLVEFSMGLVGFILSRKPKGESSLVNSDASENQAKPIDHE